VVLVHQKVKVENTLLVDQLMLNVRVLKVSYIRKRVVLEYSGRVKSNAR
jgi:hypothetical protein